MGALKKYMRFSAVIFILLWTPHTSASPETLVVMYSGIEPYVQRKDGHLSGLVYEYLNTVSEESGTPIIWENIPWKVQIPVLKAGQRQACSAMLYRTKERESYLKFSAPIGVDFGHVIIGQVNNTKLLKYQKLSDLLEDKKLTLLLQVDISYGAYIDTLLKDHAIERVIGTPQRTLYNIIDGEHDYTILPKFMGYEYVKNYGSDSGLVIYDHYKDLHSQESFYLGCSKTVSDATLKRLNKAILEQGYITAN